MTRRRGFAIMGVALCAAGTVAVGAGATGTRKYSNWKGSETFPGSVLVPNPARCKAPPDNFEARLNGTGIDTAGGPFVVTASGCVNMATMRVSDLEATDRFAGGGDSISVTTDDFTLRLDEDSCVATNKNPVAFTVAGGTGKYAGAHGAGTFHIALNWLPCSGLHQPAFVWFHGKLRIPR